MSRKVFIVGIFLMSAAALTAQTAQIAPTAPPQTARQALLEMFFGQTPDHLKKHLPEVTKKAFAKLESGASSSFLSGVEAIGMQARAGGAKLQTMETGPVLLVTEQPQTREKFEVTVERDDLIGEEDQIEVSFQMSRNRKPEALPFVPHLTFVMKTESGVWRLNELGFSARMPIGDPDFLKGMVSQLQEKQQRSNETMAWISIRAIVAAEAAYHSQHPERGFSCSLSDLASASREKTRDHPMLPLDDALISGTKNGYVFAVTGCDALHFKAAAEPATADSGQRAFCADESNEIKSSQDGKAATCLSSGQPYNGDSGGAVGVQIH